MPRTDRLFAILQHLQDHKLHKAQDLAAALGVSVRTIYRDMDTLQASGVPVEGARGVGYRLGDQVMLPQLSLTPDEFEVLNLGLAIVAEAADPELRASAERLAAKVDAVLPERAVADADRWKFAVYPFADATRSFSHLPTLRAAIRARQKLLLSYQSDPSTVTHRTVRPLQVEHFGRIWTLTAWCELCADFQVFRTDLILSAEALPEMFVDERGKRLADHLATTSRP